MADCFALFLTRLRFGVISSFQDYRAMFTWRSWLFGWMLRLVSQVLFFASLGRLVGSVHTEQAIALGNAAILGPLGALGVVSSCVGERRGGTLQFIVISPTSPFLVIASRGLYWVADGFLTSCTVLTLLPLLVAFPIPWTTLPLVLALQALITLSGYGLALTLASVSLRWPEARMYLTGGTTILLLLLTGVNVPRPDHGPAAHLAALLPATHGLTAIRTALAGHGIPLGQVLAELAVMLGWAAIAWTSMTLAFRRSGRRLSFLLS
ncbi:hypothetical protein ACICHK_41730 (plasmid) [Streptomyces sp. AHU1]|uniref:hypothetical protein n=1 Tax=Streptomyces sp. AHU1 TaxID=3377215 RepID=UPI00387799BB